MNNASIVTDQSTHQIWPSEILQGTNYCVLTLRDAPLLSSFFVGVGGGPGHKTSSVQKEKFSSFFGAGGQPENEANKNTFPLLDFICLHSLCIL